MKWGSDLEHAVACTAMLFLPFLALPRLWVFHAVAPREQRLDSVWRGVTCRRCEGEDAKDTIQSRDARAGPLSPGEAWHWVVQRKAAGGGSPWPEWGGAAACKKIPSRPLRGRNPGACLSSRRVRLLNPGS